MGLGLPATVRLRVVGRSGVPLVDVATVRLAVLARARGRAAAVWVDPADRWSGRPVMMLPSRGRRAGRLLIAPAADGDVRLAVRGAVHLSVEVTGWVPAAPPRVRPAVVPRVGVGGGGVAEVWARRPLLNANRFALGTWWRRRAGWPVQDALQAERAGSQAYALAVSLATGVYDPAAVGASPRRALAAGIVLIDRVAAGHRVNRAGGWGSPAYRDGSLLEIQAGLHAAFTARAAWLLWDELTARTRRAVLRMIEYEADRALDVPIRYYRDRAGRLLSGGNSGAEEAAWEAAAPSVAAAMLPASPHRVAWSFKATWFLLAAWARPAETRSTTRLHGAASCVWLAGSNLQPDGQVINHGRIAPDYAADGDLSIDAVLDAALAGQPAPAAAVHGLDATHRAFSTVPHPSPPYQPPGGPVYQAGHIYYPDGVDWGPGQDLHFAVFDAESALLGIGGPHSLRHAAQHAATAARMQHRFGDRHMFAAHGEFWKPTGEEQAARLAAKLLLARLLARQPPSPRLTDQPRWNPTLARQYAGQVLTRTEAKRRLWPTSTPATPSTCPNPTIPQYADTVSPLTPAAPGGHRR